MHVKEWYELRKKWSKLNNNLKYELLGIVLITTGIIGFISLLGLNVGIIGSFLVKAQKYLFGIGAIILPSLMVLIGFRYIWKRQKIVYSVKFFAILILYISLLSIYHHFKIDVGSEILPSSLINGGGLFAGGFLFLLRKLFGYDGAIIVIFSVTLISLLLASTWSLGNGLMKTKKSAEKGIHAAKETIAATYEKVKDKSTANEMNEDAFEPAEEAKNLLIYDQEKDLEDNSYQKNNIEQVDFSIDNNFEEEIKSKRMEKNIELEERTLTEPEVNSNYHYDYIVPSIAALLKDLPKVKNSKMNKEIAENAKILEQTLASFNVKVKLLNACSGPAVTRYELEPAAGVKVSKIVNLADDIALKLAASGVRIEAPIPGKAAIGIEVPNRELSGVHLREVLESKPFLEAKSKLSVGLGKDIAGQAIVADLAKMPHLLVAGATGSGKSVCINTLITSILFKARPDEVKFILIDPKMVELSNYNGIPHLMVPVVTDSKKAAAVLNWAVQEMERRYAMFAANGVRDMERYNRFVEADEKMAAIVIIIDELADLMMVAPGEVEDAICRLAQKARAAGLHLVLATQRPSVDVITGIIKANVPSRISFSVSSQIDSRTILDVAGAEKLLGKGDMLYYPVGAPKPLRVQGAFISDSEVEALIEFIKAQGEASINEEIINFAENATAPVEKAEHDNSDELLEKAIRLVLETGQASASMLQRRFRIGYTRAGRLIDTMEEMHIVGPNIGSKAREIVMTAEEVNQTYFNK